MDLQERYDELENIVSTLSVLVAEISDKDYIEQLNYIKAQAEYEQNDVDAQLQQEFDKEQKEMNRQFIDGRI